MVLMPLLSRLLTLLVILTMPLFLARLTLIPIKSLSICFRVIRSEERFSRNAETELVCRLLLEKKNKIGSVSYRQVPAVAGAQPHTAIVTVSRAVERIPP